MDGNKDEALRCVRIAEEAISSGNKERALKFIKFAKRLDHNFQAEELLAACEKLDSGSPVFSIDEKFASKSNTGPGLTKSAEGSNGERNCTEEHVQLIRHIKTNKDYYDILGVGKNCSVEEIRKAYRKLSLKVHPDKNKAPGSEEAFKKVSKAFKCLSDSDSRRQYDQMGLVDEFEHNHQYNVRRRRRTRPDLFDDDFDPDEIFRAFFAQGDMFRASQVYRTRGTASNQRGEVRGGGPSILILIQLLPFLIILLLAYLPFHEPDYSLYKNYSYQIPKMTEKYGVEFYVRSSSFEKHYPLGSQGRANIEDSVIKDYKSLLWRHCHIEVQRRRVNKNLPTPYCNKLHDLS